MLPAEYLGNSLSLPSLIASAMAFDCQEERKYVSVLFYCTLSCFTVCVMCSALLPVALYSLSNGRLLFFQKI